MKIGSKRVVSGVALGLCLGGLSLAGCGGGKMSEAAQSQAMGAGDDAQDQMKAEGEGAAAQMADEADDATEGKAEEIKKAAEAAECAREHDRFWEYHDALYANQRALDVDRIRRRNRRRRRDALAPP